MRKKSQITVFIILGLVFLLIVVMLVELRSTIMDTSQASQTARMNNLVILKKSVNDYVESTIKDSVDTGLSTNNYDHLAEYLETSLKADVDLSSFHSIDDYDIGQAIADVSFSEDQYTANIHVVLPINISSDGNRLSFSDFYLTYNLMNEATPDTDGHGQLVDDFTIHSTDAVASLTMHDGSVAVQSNGQPLGDTAIIIGEMSGIFSDQLLAFRAYDFKPDGAQFFPPAVLRIHYDDSMLPYGADESTIRMMEVQADGTLAPIDSTSDTENNVVTGYIYHFSRYVLAAEKAQTKPGNLMQCLMLYHGTWNFRDRLCMVK